MKTFFRTLSLFVCAALMFGTTACEKDNPEEDSSKDKFLQTVNEQFVEKTVIATYRTLADKVLDLEEAKAILSCNPEVVVAIVEKKQRMEIINVLDKTGINVNHTLNPLSFCLLAWNNGYPIES